MFDRSLAKALFNRPQIAKYPSLCVSRYSTLRKPIIQKRLWKVILNAATGRLGIWEVRSKPRFVGWNEQSPNLSKV
jgi:hypothetical protein